MIRYRLTPDPKQEAILLGHCAHARYVWNLAVEQQSWWRPGRRSAPGYLEQGRQLTAARAEFIWLHAGSQIVQQQALRDYAQGDEELLQRHPWQAVVAQGRAGRGVPDRRGPAG
jgi:hypothetical protein